MANLFEIDEQLRMLEEYMVDIETGEILSEEEFYKKLDEVQMALYDKIENTMCFYKNLMSDVESFKAEEKRISERRKIKENLAERLKKRIDSYIVHQFTDDEGNIDTASLNKWKMETPKVKLSYRKSDAVEITDINKLPKEFIKEKIEYSADKISLKKALVNGDKIDGATIVTNYNMQIK